MSEALGTADGHGPTTLSGADLVVAADPDKRLFIDMLVKDIELVPAVLDLVDNSVDSARAFGLQKAEARRAAAPGRDAAPGAPDQAGEGSRPDDEPEDALDPDAFEGLTVDVVANGDRFSITDNCTGMDVEVARGYAFRFGRPEGTRGVPGSVGQFGVGMKRALFKLGTDFTVASRTDHTSFEMRVDVAEWAQVPGTDWTFRMQSARTGLEPEPEARGTAVTVSPLHQSVAEDLQDQVVLGLLRQQMRIRHQEALSRGLTITLNGTPLKGLRPELLSGPAFRPVNRSFVVSEDGGEVFVRLLAGLVTNERRHVDEGQAEDFRSAGDAGWWVFCNERLLLAADRSTRTGWGNPAALYHPQYRAFRGYVYLQAINPALLPWNTTKTDVDQDSRVWRRVQAEIKQSLMEVQAVINRAKKEVASTNDDDNDDHDEQVPTPVLDALETARPVPLRSLHQSNVPVVPPPPAAAARPRTPRGSVHKVQFNVSTDRYTKAADALGARNTAEVGRGAFDYFYSREVEGQ